MADIKSTLDLVMERTRNLLMSEEDKREQDSVEFRAGVNRLTAQYLDGNMEAERFRNELQLLRKAHPRFNEKTAAAEISKRIDPLTDNEPLLTLIREGCEIEVGGLEKVLHEYAESEKSAAGKAETAILEALRKKGISGSAVVPNLGADSALAARRMEMIESFRNRLA
ncbi:MAG: hypothetical protein AAGU11_12330, partial [Syntrophobacteraceae bacterium]